MPSPPQSQTSSGTGGTTETLRPDPRALQLLAALWGQQCRLPRGPALAWERAVFAEALSHPAPRRRIQAFLGEGK